MEFTHAGTNTPDGSAPGAPMRVPNAFDRLAPPLDSSGRYCGTVSSPASARATSVTFCTSVVGM